MTPIKQSIKRACFMSALFFIVAKSSVASIVIPSDDVMNYCADAGCDNQVFYRYYASTSPRFCRERAMILENKDQSEILRYVLDRTIKKGLRPTSVVVPILESSLNPFAVASDHPNSARGLWQLKPDTARDMGLKVSVFKDERLDVTRSTDAGLRYLVWLEARFDGDHNLAVLAYHAGIGRVESMIKQHNTKNPWFLSQLFSSSSPDKDYLLKYYAYSLALMKKGCPHA
jgi:membrane-bound lytic murein transglycosylase MltF